MNYQEFISPQTEFFKLPQPFSLECGEVLLEVEVAYRTWGKLNSSGDNAVLICHALTGGADADDWWQPLFGANKAFDPEVDFIICSNVLGSCYGTTGSVSINPQTLQIYGASFPQITIRDMVNLQAVLIKALGIQRIKLVIGGSLGGMQVLEWALLYPNLVEAIVPIAVSGRHSAWCIGLSEAQRQAIYADPNWLQGNYTSDKQPSSGLAVARMMAMSTYRSWGSFEHRFGRKQDLNEFAISSYLQHQGQKFVQRFDANTYITLTRAMDSHDIARGRDNFADMLSSIKNSIVVAIDSDILYPPYEQQELAALIPNSKFAWLKSLHGHDAFLIDMAELNDLVVNFRRELAPVDARL
jgi:homoserine O-acetyltransferase/O-succinyltransferase